MIIITLDPQSHFIENYPLDFSIKTSIGNFLLSESPSITNFDSLLFQLEPGGWISQNRANKNYFFIWRSTRNVTTFAEFETNFHPSLSKLTIFCLYKIIQGSNQGLSSFNWKIFQLELSKNAKSFDFAQTSNFLRKLWEFVQVNLLVFLRSRSQSTVSYFYKILPLLNFGLSFRQRNLAAPKMLISANGFDFHRKSNKLFSKITGRVSSYWAKF